MKERLWLTVLMLIVAVAMSAQTRRITGYVTDKEMGDAIEKASVALNRKKDGKFVEGVVTDSLGNFTLPIKADGQYTLKITSVGYKTISKDISTKGKDKIDLGELKMDVDAVMLKNVAINGQATKVVVVEDTFVYNASAYHTPEGSVVEELVKRLPGAQVSDDGTITINGKTVKKIKVDGKEFMTGDTETALKNLPTSIIDKVRAYDDKSDMAKATGIDDGEEETTLDFGIKKGMNKGTMVNTDLAVGTQSRYAERLMAAYMKDDLKIMGFGQANNVGDKGFPGGGGGPRFGGGGNGLQASKMGALNLSYDKKDKLSLTGSVRWNHRDGDVWQRSSGENFLSTTSSYNNSLSNSYTRSNSWNMQMRIEWHPDTMTTVLVRPTATFSSNDSRSWGENATFNADPYELVTDPLHQLDELYQANVIVNTDSTKSLSYSSSNKVGAMMQATRKLGGGGRNITVRFNGNYSEGSSKSASTEDILYYLDPAVTMTRRYNSTPTKNTNITVKAAYTEPLGKKWFAQLSYSYKYSLSKSDRSTYSYDNILGFKSWIPEYRNWDSFLSYVPGDNPFDPQYYDSDLSKHSEYTNYTHDIQMQIQKQTKNLRLAAGVLVEPQRSHFIQDYQGVQTDTVRNVTNISPTVDFRYKISKVSQIRLTYRGETSQPSISDMLNIVDDSNPLNIKVGNPGLKPSFTQSMRLFYNGYAQNHMQSWMTNINFSTTSNDVSSMVTYDPETGIKVTKPDNINGNWSANAAVMYNGSIDSAGVFTVNTFTNFGYRNQTSYLYQQNTQVTDKNTTRTTTVSERLGLSYRNTWLEVEPNGSFTYQKVRNLLQSNNNLNTWTFAYGMNFTVTCPWGTSISTDASMNSRRGYSDAALNTNEFIWNAQIAQSFLKGKKLTLSLQFYDILKQQSTLSRSITSTQRTDTEYNAINSYAMLHVIYRFNSFGGRDAHKQFGRGGRRGDDEGPGGRPDFHDNNFRPMGPPPGGGGHGGPM